VNSNVQPYPHVTINVDDRSIYVAPPVEILPAFRPLFVMPAQKGPTNVVTWNESYSVAAKRYGAETFNVLNSTYYTNQALYLNQIFQHNGAFICRVAEEGATKALVIFELMVEETTIPNYVVDTTGHRTVDLNGDWVVSNPVTVTGLQLTWQTRFALVGAETDMTDLAVRTVGDVTYYPMFAVEATNEGVWGNDLAFSLFFDADANDADQVSRCGGLFFTMAPIVKDFGKSTTSSIRDIYDYTQVNFMVKPDVTDPKTTQQVSLAEVITNRYTATDLPFAITVYSENFKTVGDLLVELTNDDDPQQDEFVDGWYVNLLTGMHPDGRYYKFAQVLTDQELDPVPVLMMENVYHYLTTGTDGSLATEDIEELMSQFFTLSLDPTIVDQLRYPFNYVFDVGHDLPLKYTMLDFMAIRDDVRVSVCTQVTSIAANDAAADESAGASLREHARLMRESIIKGTEACRASVWAHCGIPLVGNNRIVPLNLWDAKKHAEYQNTVYLNQEPAGLPNSLVELFHIDTINWIPSSEQQKSLFWNDSINYLAYANMTQIHYPATRTVYPYDTSVLVRNVFVDAIVYAKQRIRASWAKYVDVQMDFALLSAMIKNDLISTVGELFNGKYPFTVVVYQTEEEARLGFVVHVTLTITAPANFRVWDVDIVCKRQNYEAA
jgi:hypothetical protein